MKAANSKNAVSVIRPLIVYTYNKTVIPATVFSVGSFPIYPVKKETSTLVQSTHSRIRKPPWLYSPINPTTYYPQCHYFAFVTF